MNIFRLSTIFTLIFMLTACEDSTNKNMESQNANSAQQNESLVFITANNFSDTEWKNGVLNKDGRTNLFYFLQQSGESQKLMIDNKLRFAKSGDAVVQKITPSVPNQNGIISVFVTIDKDLDPIGDGYPNKIFIISKDQPL
jgi:hypothetical protein